MLPGFSSSVRSLSKEPFSSVASPTTTHAGSQTPITSSQCAQRTTSTSAAQELISSATGEETIAAHQLPQVARRARGVAAVEPGSELESSIWRTYPRQSLKHAEHKRVDRSIRHCLTCLSSCKIIFQARYMGEWLFPAGQAEMSAGRLTRADKLPTPKCVRSSPRPTRSAASACCSQTTGTPR
jgi:hypothetical protein